MSIIRTLNDTTPVDKGSQATSPSFPPSTEHAENIQRLNALYSAASDPKTEPGKRFNLLQSAITQAKQLAEKQGPAGIPRDLLDDKNMRTHLLALGKSELAQSQHDMNAHNTASTSTISIQALRRAERIIETLDRAGLQSAEQSYAILGGRRHINPAILADGRNQLNAALQVLNGGKPRDQKEVLSQHVALTEANRALHELARLGLQTEEQSYAALGRRKKFKAQLDELSEMLGALQDNVPTLSKADDVPQKKSSSGNLNFSFDDTEILLSRFTLAAQNTVAPAPQADLNLQQPAKTNAFVVT